MYESPGPQFFRTTTGVQAGPDAFDKSKLFTYFQQTWKLGKYYAVSD